MFVSTRKLAWLLGLWVFGLGLAWTPAFARRPVVVRWSRPSTPRAATTRPGPAPKGSRRPEFPRPGFACRWDLPDGWSGIQRQERGLDVVYLSGLDQELLARIYSIPSGPFEPLDGFVDRALNRAQEARLPTSLKREDKELHLVELGWETSQELSQPDVLYAVRARRVGRRVLVALAILRDEAAAEPSVQARAEEFLAGIEWLKNPGRIREFEAIPKG